MRKKTIEDYLEILYILEQTQSPVHTNDVAQAFDVNPASVTEIFQKLHEEGYIKYKRYSGASLTTKGKNLARSTKQKHEILKEFFITLGVDEKTADHDACHIEHVVHAKTMKKLTCFVEFAKNEDGQARWLEHYRHFEKTGTYIPCTPQTKKKCSLDGRSKKK